MNRSEKLSVELYNSVFGDPWHGTGLKDILEKISFKQSDKRSISSAHNIIELTLHLDAWTEETLKRFIGGQPSLPTMRDWPIFKDKSEEYWQAVKQKLFADTNKLIAVIKKFSEKKLDKIVGEERNAPLGTGFSFEGLIIGLVQHNAYRAGQIALLKKKV
ncbi:MAG: DinB family protein [Ignavibacteriales bacterium]|nr:MAG: DinB family protein [Ignavibacteriales bacterium]